MKKILSFIKFFCVIVLLSSPVFVYAQPSNFNCTCMTCQRPCNNHASGCYYNPNKASSVAKPSGTNSPSSSGDINVLIIQSVFNALLAPPSGPSAADQAKLDAQRAAQEAEMQRIALEKAEKKRIKDSMDAVAYDQLMKMSKPIPGGDAKLDFKTLDGDAENLSRAASDQFMPSGIDSSHMNASGGTNFFGMGLSSPEFQTLMDPDNDPMIVDLTEANTFIVDNLKKDEVSAGEPASKEEPKNEVPDKAKCLEMETRLASDLANREKFQKTIDLTLTELNKWKEQNNAAFWNAVTDGLNTTAGVFLDYVIESRKQAAAIQKVIIDNQQKWIDNKVFTPESVKRYKDLTDLRLSNYEDAVFGKQISNAADYYGLLRNSIQAVTERLSGTDSEYREMCKILQQGGYLGDFPIVDAAQFLAGKTIEAFMKNPETIVTKNLKIGYVTIAQLAVDEFYNAMDWYLSYKNICTLRDVSGKELEAAKYLQSKIDEKRAFLSKCK